MRKLFFENETCSRCGGCGEYSYCQMYGRRCFKCAGDGVTLTKRGKAAQHWFNRKKIKPARDVRIGDKVVFDGVPGFSAAMVVTVDFVGYRENGSKYLKDGEWLPFYSIEGADKNGKRHNLGCFENSDVKMHVWGDAKAALLAEAKAYQDTLTKAGTVRKNIRSIAA